MSRFMLGVALVCLSLGAFTANPAAAKNWADGTGNWNVPANWSPASVPTAGEAVNIVFNDGVARTVTYNVTTPALGLLTIDLSGIGAVASTLVISGANDLTTNGIIVGGYTGSAVTSGRGELVQSAGNVATANGQDVVLGFGAGSRGVYTLSGGTLLSNRSEFIGYGGTGTFNHSGGTNRILINAGSFEVGALLGSTGVYNLSGTGSLTAGRTEYVGRSGAGTFNQTGGSNTVSGGSSDTHLVIGGNADGVGTYNLSGGSLSTLGGFGDEYIGLSGIGFFNQSGGVHMVGNRFSVGRNASSSGTFTLSGGTFRTNTRETVGDFGTGAFIHTGGTNILGSDDLYVGSNRGSQGYYELSGTGSLSGDSDEIIGYNGVGTFLQTGGTNTLTGAGGRLLLGLGTGSGAYSLTAGTAFIGGGVYVGGSVNEEGASGILNVSGTGVMTIGVELKVYDTAGTAVTLAGGGRINAAALNFGGVPSRLNWTGGTLNLTTTVSLDSAAAASTTSAAFGSALSLGVDQTLLVTGNETLGGVGSFDLTLNSGSSHHVTGALTLAPTGTLTQNAGSTLYATTIVQAGGTVNGTLQNQGAFVYQSGQFNGRLLNQGTVSFGANFTTGNGIENEATMTLAAGQTLTVNGAGLDNLGTFSLASGVISGSGPALNNYGGTLQGRGAINSAFTNNGVLEVDGVLRFNGASAINNGIVRGSGTLIGAFENAAGGTLALAAGDLLAISSAWTNSGQITMAGSGAALGGGTIANLGTIQGAGAINSPITNAGVIRAAGGELDLGATGISNGFGGLIQAAAGSTVMVLQGLAENSGTIALTDGAFDNNNHALSNTGLINGHGVLRTSTLTSDNKLNVGEGNLDIFGSVINNGTIGIQGGRSIYFYGDVTGSGSYTGIGTAVFLAAVSPGSSPAAVSFGGNATLASTSTLEIELGGAMAGSQFDQLLVAGALELGGVLNVSLINSFAPTAGNAFDILNWGVLTGTFSSLVLPSLGGGLDWNTSQLYTTGILSVIAAGIAGDYNQDNRVDAADYSVYRDNLGSNVTLPNDTTPGSVTAADYAVWQANFGAAVTSSSTTAASVPEPTALILSAILLLAFTAVATRRRPQQVQAVVCLLVTNPPKCYGRTSHRSLMALLVVLTITAADDRCSAQTVWTAGADDWFAPANWTLGVPSAASGTAFDAIIANGGTPQISAPGGSVRRLRVGLAGGPGSLVVDGGTLAVTENLHLNEGSFGPASVTVQNGATVTSPTTIVGFSSAADTNFLISGAGTTFNAATQFIVAHSGAGTASLTVESGAVLTSQIGYLGNLAGSHGVGVVRNPGSSWSTAGQFAVGNLGVGTLTIEDQGVVSAGTNLFIAATSNVNLNGGTLRFNTITGVSRLNFSAGTVQLAGNRNLGSDPVITTLFGATPTIPSGKGLTVEGQGTIAAAAAETVVVDGGRLTIYNGIAIGGGGNGTLQVINGGTVVGLAQNGFAVGGAAAGRTGSLLISGAGSSVDLQSGVSIGTVSGGAGGSLVIAAGGVLKSFSGVIGGLTAGATGTVTVTGPGSAWNLSPTSPLNVGFAAAGTLNIQDQGLVFVGTNLFIPDTGTVHLDGGVLRFNTLSDASNRLFFNSGTIQLAGNRTLGSDAVITRFFGTTPVLVAGKGITVEGTATVSSGLTIFGGAFRATDLAISGPFIFGGGLLELTGGTITGLTQLNVPTNGEFHARGLQSMRVTGAAGSTITATGDLTLGNAFAVNGFATQGTLQVGTNRVTLVDANDAVLDSLALVTLGSGGSPGTLAANRLRLDFGGNITGYGAIETSNDISKPLINNGHITGNSVAEPITLSGYVKGVGTFDNVNFTGTFSPGLSPTSLQVGNISLTPTSKLIMELGGTAPGSGYDQLNSSGTITLDGTLELVLINGFIPTAGQTFDIFSGGDLVGAFSVLILPVVPGLTWDTSQLEMGLLSAGLPGDYNFNGVVDAADYTAWRDNLGAPAGTLPNDIDGGTIGTAQYTTWRANYKLPRSSGALTFAAVPEPGTMVLLFLAATGWCVLRGPASSRFQQLLNA